jgi:hypothetical protein
MSAPMRVVGLDGFQRACRELERIVPGEVDDMLTGIMEDDLLPTIQEDTPVGDGRSGTPERLKNATRVAKVRGRPGFVNTKVYANTIHWGRKKRGVVVGRKFIWDAAKRHRVVIEQRLEAGVNRLIEQRLP